MVLVGVNILGVSILFLVVLLLIIYFFRVLSGISELDIKKLIAKLLSLLKLYLEWWGVVI